MKTITDQLIEASNGILKNSPEVSNPNYSAQDDGGIEYETGEFLYGLVRLLKPKHILETGIYSGISTMYMAQGMKDNGSEYENPDNHTDFAQIFTCDIEQTHIDRSKRLWETVGVNQYILPKLIPSLDVIPATPDYDLIFLDSEPQIRFQELIKFFPHLKEGGYLLIHDLFGHLGQGGPINPDHPEIENWPFGTLPNQIRAWLQTDVLRIIPLPAPRGLVMFYKVKDGDFEV